MWVCYRKVCDNNHSSCKDQEYSIFIFGQIFIDLNVHEIQYLKIPIPLTLFPQTMDSAKYVFMHIFKMK